MKQETCQPDTTKTPTGRGEARTGPIICPLPPVTEPPSLGPLPPIHYLFPDIIYSLFWVPSPIIYRHFWVPFPSFWVPFQGPLPDMSVPSMSGPRPRYPILHPPTLTFHSQSCCCSTLSSRSVPVDSRKGRGRWVHDGGRVQDFNAVALGGVHMAIAPRVLL